MAALESVNLLGVTVGFDRIRGCRSAEPVDRAGITSAALQKTEGLTIRCPSRPGCTGRSAVSK
jgi:hypothetical protein